MIVTCISCIAFLCFQIFLLFWGIDGVLWAGPAADGLSGILVLILVHREMKSWRKEHRFSSEKTFKQS